MKFIDNLDKEEYIEFFNNFKYSHFMQSYPWGLAMEETRGKKAIYVGLKDNKNKFINLISKLDSLSPLKTLSRGYTITQKGGKVIKSAHVLNKEDNIEIKFIDGTVNAKIE